MSIRDQFGTPRDGSGVNFITFSNTKPGSSESKVLRFLPPMHSLREKGKWGEYHKLHYGYAVRDPRDAEKTKMRPFLCIKEENADGLVTKTCPECLKVQSVLSKMKDDMAKEVERLRPLGVVGEDAQKAAMTAVTETADWLNAHNRDQKWYIPVMQEDLTFGILKVPHAAKKVIDKARRQLLTDEKRDIFDLDAGAWVKLTRSGTGRTTEYDAVIVKEARVLADGTRVAVTKQAPMSEEQLKMALELPDVAKSPAIVRVLSVEQIRVLANGGGSPQEVEAVLNLSQRAGPEDKPSHQPQASSPRVVESPTPRPTPAPQPTQNAEDAEIERLEMQLAARRAIKAAQQPPQMTPQMRAAVPLPSSLNDISDEEFLARFPPPQ